MAHGPDFFSFSPIREAIGHGDGLANELESLHIEITLFGGHIFI